MQSPNLQTAKHPGDCFLFFALNSQTQSTPFKEILEQKKSCHFHTTFDQKAFSADLGIYIEGILSGISLSWQLMANSRGDRFGRQLL